MKCTLGYGPYPNRRLRKHASALAQRVPDGDTMAALSVGKAKASLAERSELLAAGTSVNRRNVATLWGKRLLLLDQALLNLTALLHSHVRVAGSGPPISTVENA